VNHFIIVFSFIRERHRQQEKYLQELNVIRDQLHAGHVVSNKQLFNFVIFNNHSGGGEGKDVRVAEVAAAKFSSYGGGLSSGGGGPNRRGLSFTTQKGLFDNEKIHKKKIKDNFHKIRNSRAKSAPPRSSFFGYNKKKKELRNIEIGQK